MEFRKVEIPYKSSEWIKVIPIGDVHLGNSSSDIKKLKSIIEYIKDKKDTYWIGMGDYIEAINYSDPRFDPKSVNAKYLVGGDIDKIVQLQIKDIVELLKPIKDKCLGLLRGNHEETIRKYYHFDVLYEMAKDLDLDRSLLLYDTAIVRLLFKRGVLKQNKHSRQIDMLVSHGNAGGRTYGYKSNRLAELTKWFVADVYLLAHCISEDTEILTADGWKKANEVNKGDKIYSFNIDKKIIEKDTINDIIIQNYTGKMYNIKNINVDMLVTPNHKVLYRFVSQRPGKTYNHKWYFKTAEEISKMSSQIQVPLSSHYSINDKKEISNSILEILGWIISEGSYCKGHDGIRIAQSTKNKKYNILKSTLDESGIPYSVHQRGFYIPAKYAKEIHNLLPHHKKIPNWIVALNDVQFGHFLDGLLFGDGSMHPNGGIFVQKDEDTIDILQGLLALHGYRSRKYYRKHGYGNGCWYLNITKRETTDLALSKDNIVKEIDYNGIVWCVTTKNHTFIARRNGYVFITGNSHTKQAQSSTQIRFDRYGNQKKKKTIHAITGCFLKSYVVGKNSYAEKLCLPPSDIGVVKLMIQPETGDLHISL